MDFSKRSFAPPDSNPLTLGIVMTGAPLAVGFAFKKRMASAASQARDCGFLALLLSLLLTAATYVVAPAARFRPASFVRST
jgi:hypothetical protein